MMNVDNMDTSVANEVQHDENGFSIGDNDITIPLDSAIANGGDGWKELDGKSISVNVLTMIRNALSAFDKGVTGVRGIDMFSNPMAIETILVPRIIDDISNFTRYMDDVHNCRVVLYTIEYSRLSLARLPNYRVAKTDNQKKMDKIYNSTLSLIDVPFKTFDDRTPPDSKYLLSHIVYDALVSASTIKVVESHTGAIKDRYELNTKLNLTSDETFIVPLTIKTYLMYGDGVLLNKNVKITRSLLDVFTKSRITPMSSEMRLNFAIKNKLPLVNKLIDDILRI